MLTITSGIVTYILYGAVIGLSIYNLHKCRVDTRFPQYVRLSVFTLSLLQIVMSIVFIVLQSDWLFMDYNALVGLETSLAWLLFDLSNGLVHLCMGLAIKFSHEYKTSNEKPLQEIMSALEHRLLMRGINANKGLRLIPCKDYQEGEGELCNTPCKEYCKFNKEVCDLCEDVTYQLKKDVDKLKTLLEPK